MMFPHASSGRRWLINLFAIVVLSCFALDTLPCTPAPIRTAINPLLDSLGLWQGTWKLFAPIPDSQNHRLRADLYYADGTHHVWNSPEWRSLSRWQRFVGHRQAEFLDKITEESFSAAWQDFARSIGRSESSRRKMPDQPVKIVLTKIWGEIPPPEGDVWKLASTAVPLTEEEVFFTWMDPNPTP